MKSKKFLNIAVVGCIHGELDMVFRDIKKYEMEKNTTVDVCVCCGDFQATRNQSDLQSMACPNKYKKMIDFHKYYSGEKKAPVLVIFIGGNHEAVVHSCVSVGGVRIAGVSGIEKAYDYKKASEQRSIYHIRQFDVEKMRMLSTSHVMLSHDWPFRIYKDDKNIRKNLRTVSRRKTDLAVQSMQRDEIGSKGLEAVLKSVKPQHWFSAHFHCRYETEYKHNSSSRNESKAKRQQRQQQQELTTRFLALDKTEHHRKYIDFVQIPRDPKKKSLALEYDLEWLAITKVTQKFFSVTRNARKMPPLKTLQKLKTKTMQTLKEANVDLRVPRNWRATAKAFSGERGAKFISTAGAPTSVENPQRTEFLNLISESIDPIALMVKKKKKKKRR